MSENENYFTNNESNVLEWKTPEYPFKEKSREWYISLVVIGIGFVIGAIMLENYIFAILSIVAVLSIFIITSNPPKEVLVSISKKGVSIGSKEYHYSKIESFWVNELEEPPRLLIKTRDPLSSLISIQIIGVDEDDVRIKMIRYVEEEEMYEPVIQRLMEHLGI